jgi:cytidine deaminase
MITNGESEIDKVVAVMSDGSVGSPCGACRELMMQLSSESYKIEILTDKEAKTTVTLGDVMPDWWGRARFDE